MQFRRPRFDSWVRKNNWRRIRLPTPVFSAFPCGSAGKESACKAGHLDSIPGLGRSPGEGNGYPLQYSGLENSMDWIAHGVAKSRKQLSHFHFHFHALNLYSNVCQSHLNKTEETRSWKKFFLSKSFFKVKSQQMGNLYLASPLHINMGITTRRRFPHLKNSKHDN